MSSAPHEYVTISYETKRNHLSSKVVPGNRNTLSGAFPRQGIIHARPGKTGAAPQLSKELRNSCGARQGRVISAAKLH